MDVLRTIYRALLKDFGPQRWWPADTPFEVCVGAILTQNTNWGNVEKAIRNLEEARLLDPRKLGSVRLDRLAQIIKPSGYYNLKSKRLKDFVKWFLKRLNGSVRNADGIRTAALRKELLKIPGVGPETADSILLYAFGRPSFVVDAYTRRFMERHRFIKKGASYDEVKLLFESGLKRSRGIFNEFHALIVRLGKTYCRREARCKECPLDRFEHV